MAPADDGMFVPTAPSIGGGDRVALPPVPTLAGYQLVVYRGAAQLSQPLSLLKG